ncbi:phosphorylase [Methylococcus sp. EFPC2]|uniref:phosphorylase family protein n=1 Tax=Methylococcus sp. EFPC2 TaxID=2812648 RepID=UPI0019681D8C|nr:phosphorylase [Methylococcus sp. EFPC2]QSA97108.1 phosphorylase [Methylococcus sp. EFPC2]
MKRVGIVVALPDEARSLHRTRLNSSAPVALDESRLLIISGAGPKAAASAATALVNLGISGLVSWGCAAALAPALRPGDLALPHTLHSPDGAALDTTSYWRERIAATLAPHINCHHGTLAGSVEIVATASAKRTLHERTGALALDMESVALARTAQKYALPFVAIRAIADPASMSLPGAVVAGMDEAGHVRIPRLLGHALRHPTDFIGLIQLGAHFRAALQTLTLAANHLGPDLAV